MASQVTVGSPVVGEEGTVSLTNGGRVSRLQAKKIIKDEISTIVSAMKLLPNFYKKVIPTGRAGLKVTGIVDDQTVSYHIGMTEINDFMNQIIVRIKKLHPMMFALTKTHRKTAPNTGFMAPSRFVSEMVNFFTRASIGPVVTGRMVGKQGKDGNWKNIPESTSLVASSQIPLNQLLYFTMPQINGQANPLYGIISPGTLTPLFALHAYYAQHPTENKQGLYNTADASRLSASMEMRQILKPVMIKTINRDAQILAEKYINNPAVLNQIQQIQLDLIRAIDDPNLQVNSNIGKAGIFNPNFFLYAHVSKLISNAKVPVLEQGQAAVAGQLYSLTTEELNNIRARIPAVYANIQGIAREAFDAINNEFAAQVRLAEQNATTVPTSPPYENVIIKAEQDAVSFARAYKNQILLKTRRDARKAEREAKKATQQAAVQVGPLTVGTVQGLPGASLQGVPQVGGVTVPQLGGLQLPQGGVTVPQVGGVTVPQVGGVTVPQVGGLQLPQVGGLQLPQGGGVQLPQGGVTVPQIGGLQLPQGGGVRM